MSRPFGVAMLFAGVDQEGAKLFHLDPSGTFIDCKAKSIGAASDGAEQNLKEQYHDVGRPYTKTMPTKLTFRLSQLGKDSKWHLRS